LDFTCNTTSFTCGGTMYDCNDDFNVGDCPVGKFTCTAMFTVDGCDGPAFTNCALDHCQHGWVKQMLGGDEPLESGPCCRDIVLPAVGRFEDLWAHVRRSGRAAGPEELYYLLRLSGIAAESATQILARLARSGHVRFPPLTHMELFLTESCNLACRYCFVEGKNTKNRMTLDVARRAVAFLLEHSAGAPGSRSCSSAVNRSWNGRSSARSWKTSAKGVPLDE